MMGEETNTGTEPLDFFTAYILGLKHVPASVQLTCCGASVDETESVDSLFGISEADYSLSVPDDEGYFDLWTSSPNDLRRCASKCGISQGSIDRLIDAPVSEQRRAVFIAQAKSYCARASAKIIAGSISSVDKYVHRNTLDLGTVGLYLSNPFFEGTDSDDVTGIIVTRGIFSADSKTRYFDIAKTRSGFGTLDNEQYYAARIKEGTLIGYFAATTKSHDQKRFIDSALATFDRCVSILHPDHKKMQEITDNLNSFIEAIRTYQP
jgi:hypothetical protein